MARLPGLDLLRFYAALCVVVWHVPVDGESWRMPGWLSGWEAVTVFFVVSGFLITYLLLHERERTGEVDVKAFYLRRALRILPLYFAVLYFCYALLPMGAVDARITFSLFALIPNIPPVHWLPLPLGALWSIGAEEQFYLAYPRLFRRFNLVRLAWGIIAVRWLVVLLAFVIDSDDLMQWCEFNRFDAMAVGALAGWSLYHQNSVTRWLRRCSALVLLAFALVMLETSLDDISVVYNFALAWMTAALLIVIVQWRRLDNAPVRYLGALSYGVYLWHLPVLALLLRADMPTFETRLWTVVLTLLIAALSYRFIERPALQLKTRFSA